MGLLLAIIQFLLIAGICLFEVKRKSPSIFLWATLMIMFGVMHLYSVFTGNSEYTSQTLNEASLFAIGFCCVYLVVRLLLWHFKGKYDTVLTYDSLKKDQATYPPVLVALFVLVCFLICYSLISFSGGLMNTSWSSGRDFTATLSYVNFYQIYNILYFSLGGLSLYLWATKKRTASIICLIMAIIVTVVTRNRILVLPILVFVLALFVLNIKKLQIKHIILAGVAGVLVIYVVYGLRVFRHYGTIEVFIRDFNLIEFINKINLYIATDNGELGLRNDFYYFVEGDNQFEGFGKMATYIRMLLVYIPTRFSFGLKPADFAQTMGAAKGMVAGGSTHPTLFGDCYANAGWFGILLGAFWAIYSFIADKLIIRFNSNVLKSLVFCLLSVTYVIIGRGSVYNSFYFVAWGIPMLWVMTTVLEKFYPKVAATATEKLSPMLKKLPQLKHKTKQDNQ